MFWVCDLARTQYVFWRAKPIANGISTAVDAESRDAKLADSGTAPALCGGASSRERVVALRCCRASRNAHAPSAGQTRRRCSHHRGGARARDRRRQARAGRALQPKRRQAGARRSVAPCADRAGALGACHIQQGRLVEGTEALRKVLREPLPAQPSPALHKAYERAQQILDRDQAEDRPRPTIVARAVAARGKRCRLGRRRHGRWSAVAHGAARRRAADRSRRARDRKPQRPGYAPALFARSFRSRPARSNESCSRSSPPSHGQRWSLAQRSRPSRTDHASIADAAPTSPPSAARARTPLRAAPASRSHTSAYVTWAVSGAVALAIGTGFGIAAITRNDSLAIALRSATCAPRRARGELDRAKQFGTVRRSGSARRIVGGRFGRGAVLYHGAHG